MEVQPSLVLLQKTLLNIEGLGRQLYPQLDLWNTAQPLLEDWLRQRYSPRTLFKKLSRKLPHWLEQLPDVPDQLLNHLAAPVARTPIPPIAPIVLKPRQPRRAFVAALVLIAASIAYGAPDIVQHLSQLPRLSWLGLSIAALLLLRG